MVSWTVKISFLFLGVPWISQACLHRGQLCGMNSFYCYDELTESWQCQCEVGYDNQDPNRGNGFSCTDINECVIHQHKCGTNTWCNNIEGSYRCLCIDGFQQLQVNHAGYHVCSDLDECSGNARCPENSYCVNLAGSYNCSCSAGFSQGDGFCYDVDECMFYGEDLCGLNAVCINQIGSYNCRCADGNLNYTCKDSLMPITDVPSLKPIPVSNFKEGNAVDRDQTRKGNRGIEGELTEMEPQNTSVFVGVGTGLGIFLIATVFVVGYVIFVKKRRRQSQADSVQMDLSSLRLSTTSIDVEATAGSGGVATSNDATPKENQYYTIHPEPNPPPDEAENIESLYSNRKIEKIPKMETTPVVLVSSGQTVTSPGERNQNVDCENPIVYQIFNGSRGRGSTEENGVRICNANPKTLKTSIPRTSSSEQLNYTTIFDNIKESPEFLSTGQEVRPVALSEPLRDGSGRLLSTDTNSTATYDRLEKRSIPPKALICKAGQYENIYGETSLNPSSAGTEGPPSTETRNKHMSSAYEFVQIFNDK